MRIAISGHSGCGNTTATRNVGNALNLKIINFTFRDLAQELGKSFEEIHQEAMHNLVYDYLTDMTLIRTAIKNPQVVVGTRLAAWLLNADLRIWLHAPLETRAARINKRESERGASYEETLYKTLKRDAENKKRYLMLYGLDIEDHTDFDITINTHQLTAEQVSGLITTAANWARTNALERKNLHLTRIVEIISENLHISIDDLMNPELDFDLKDVYKSVPPRRR